MANTYSQIYIQIVFTVRSKLRLIDEDFREELHKYITGIVQNNGHKLMAIYCMPDHVHVLVGLKPFQAISDLVREIKSSSTNWINENRLTTAKFGWQEGYGAFSYATQQVERVIQYIRNQPEHHRKVTFRDEYLESLEEFHAEFDPRYVFD